MGLSLRHSGLRIQGCHFSAWATTVAQVQPLARELPHAADEAKKKKKKERKVSGHVNICQSRFRFQSKYQYQG